MGRSATGDMVRTCRMVMAGLLLILCLGGQWEEGALRRGYAAYQRGDLVQAIEEYKQALQASHDPGRVAYDLATVYAKAMRYHEAGLCFSQALEDARGLRRVKSAYGLGTALTEIAVPLRGRRAAGSLRQALHSFDMAQRSLSELTPDEKELARFLSSDIQHNRQVAEALLARKLQEPPDPQDEQETRASEEPSLSEILTGNRPGSGSESREPGLRNQGSNGTGNSESSPGRGNLPPLPDAEAMPPISREEALRRLDELKRRLKTPLHSTPALPGSRDW